MPRAASGSYTNSATSFNPAVSGAVIDPAVWNTLLADFQTTFTDSWSRSGKGAATANLSMGGFRMRLVGTSVSAGDAVSLSAADIRYQPKDADLTALATTAAGANRIPYFTSSSSASFFASTTGGRALVGVTGAANTIGYWTSSSSATSTSFSSNGRNIVKSLVGQLPGTATNDSANSGNIGQFISKTLSSASATSLTNNTAKNLCSIALSAGDWDVNGTISFTPNAATTITQWCGWCSSTSATVPSPPAAGGIFQILYSTALTGVAATYPTGTMRFSVSSSTTVYLSALSSFAVNTNTAYGFIRARRAR
jgi:hypothetical protein